MSVASTPIAPVFHVKQRDPGRSGSGWVDVVGPTEFATASGASPRAMDDLQRFHDLLAKRSAQLNLVGPSALAQFWPRHAWDSAQLLSVTDATTFVDIGAGAGFPGLVLAILLRERPGACVHLVESVAKRCRFLQEVVDGLGLPAVVHHARAEAMSPVPQVEIVTARACAPLTRLLGYAEPFLRAGAVGLFPKGRSAADELADARGDWSFYGELIPSRSDPSGSLVRIEGLTRAR